MRTYDDKFVKSVRLIRDTKHLTYAALSRKLKIPSGTLRNWCHQEGLSRKDAISLAYQNKRDLHKSSEVKIVPNIHSLSKNQAKLFAGILYGCEGSKYPASSRISFTNTDPDLMLTFLKLLIKGFDIDPNKFRLHLQIHNNQSYGSLKQFWESKLNLKHPIFIKPTITCPKGKKHRQIYMGTCTLRYHDYSLQLKLLGIFERFIGVGRNNSN